MQPKTEGRRRRRSARQPQARNAPRHTAGCKRRAMCVRRCRASVLSVALPRAVLVRKRIPPHHCSPRSESRQRLPPRGTRCAASGQRGWECVRVCEGGRKAGLHAEREHPAHEENSKDRDLRACKNEAYCGRRAAHTDRCSRALRAAAECERERLRARGLCARVGLGRRGNGRRHGTTTMDECFARTIAARSYHARPIVKRALTPRVARKRTDARAQVHVCSLCSRIHARAHTRARMHMARSEAGRAYHTDP